jgi:Cdc6-like AAA superfamily ATPase
MSKVASQALRCTADEARAIFAAFPAKAQRSLPGHAIATVIDIIGSDRTAPLQEALAQLFPDEPFDKARRRLTTEIANRVYVDDTGNAPLKIVQTRKGVEPALLWLERLNVADTRGLTDVGERYAADTFVSAEATQKTSAEIVADIAESAYTAPPESNDESPTPHNAAQQPKPNPAYNAARDHTITQLVKPHNAANDSLRGSNLAQEHFTDTEAAQADGFSAFAEPTKAEPHNTVNALDAMLAWAADSSATAPKLLALLGDYGTGKTSHALQFSRVLNSDVAHPNRPASLSALHIDLAYLRGAPGLAQLNVTQIIGLVIEARGLDKVLSPNIVVREVREGRRILVYDGLDELMQTDHAQLHSVFRQLLQVLEPDPVTREPSRARLIVSCRTHYFRDLTEQHEFFNTRLRHSVTRKDYLCLYLLPWKAATVRDYLNRRLTATEATALSDTIATTYNLEELASRPVLLAMMCEQVGEVLRLRDAGGGAVTASTLYAQTVAMWVRRDDEKHVLQATHKPVLMGALACAMWNDGKEFWSGDRLDRWLRKAVDALFPGHYSPMQTQAIQDDLRTATFIVRPGHSGFTFAHRSFMEFFLARHLVTLMDWEELPTQTLRTQLPQCELNRQSLLFLKEMHSSQAGKIASRSAKLWQWLSYCPRGDTTGVSQTRSAAPQSHLALFHIACAINANAALDSPRANLRWIHLYKMSIGNMQLPPLDMRRAVLSAVVFFNCRIPSVWAKFANLSAATFINCSIDECNPDVLRLDKLLFR